VHSALQPAGNRCSPTRFQDVPRNRAAPPLVFPPTSSGKEKSMPKMKPDRLDRRGGLGVGGPQQGDIGGDDDRQQQQDSDAESTGGMGASQDGQAGQRHPGGSSRDR
jgi:hypothetical protein